MAADQHGIHGKHGTVGSTPCGTTGLSPHPAMIDLARLLARLFAQEIAVGQPDQTAKRAAKIADAAANAPMTRNHQRKLGGNG